MVDDLIAIVIIAFVFTDELNLGYLGLSLIPIILFTVLARYLGKFFAKRRWAAWAILLPLGIITWIFVFGSGIHVTIAGVVFGFCVPVKRTDGKEGIGLAERFEHRFRPLSSGFCIPIFAFFAAGVTVVFAYSRRRQCPDRSGSSGASCWAWCSASRSASWDSLGY